MVDVGDERERAEVVERLVCPMSAGLAFSDSEINICDTQHR